MKNLKDSRIIITGAAKGIGRALAMELSAEGAELALWDIQEKELERTASDLREKGAAVYSHVCDITSPGQVSEAAGLTMNEMGGVDILINNAGTVKSGPFCSLPAGDWDQLTRVNLNSMYYTIQAVLPGMYERNCGHIVNISSGAGLVGMPDLAVYCATKWAVYGLTESLRMEALRDGKKGVRFTSVHPGILRKGLFEGSRFNTFGEALIPRISSHEHIARAIVRKGLKRKKSVVMKPWSLKLGPLMRGIMSDSWLNRIMLVAGAGHTMDTWKGR